MLVAAAALWSSRSQQAMEADMQARVQAENRQSQRAGVLLGRNFWAENNLRYSAHACTMTMVHGKPVTVEANITRVPHQLVVKFLSGPVSGVETGYSERWFWRQVKAGPVTPYAEVREDANQMANRRFDILVRNYAVLLGEPQTMDGRKAEVVELRPWHPVEGAHGPARRLYIDDETGLTLGVDAYNHLLQPVLHSRLSELNVSPKIGADTFEQPQAIRAAARQVAWGTEELGRTEEQFREVVQKSGILPPRPTYTPDGFVLDGYALQRCHESKGHVMTVSTRYTDGLNTLTVFALHKPANGTEKPMSCDFGPGNLVSRQDGAGSLVALSDLPAPVLQRVLDSAHFELADGAATGTEPAR